MNKETVQKIKQLNIENIIWIVFIFLSIGAIVSNEYEKNFVIYKRKKDAKTFRTLNIIIIVIAFLIYIYYVRLNYKNISNLRKKISSNQKIFFSNISLIASILFLVAGAVSVYAAVIARNNEQVDIEF